MGTETGVKRGETSTGLDPNVAGALSYLFGFITGLIFYLIEKDSDYVRFHAAQSMVVFGGLALLGVALSVLSTFLSVLVFGDPVGGVGIAAALVSLFIGLAWLVVSAGAFVLWIFLMVRAYQGKRTRVPLAAGYADRLV